MHHQIFFSPGWTYGRRDDFSCCHLEVGKQRLSTLATLVKLSSLHRAWHHRPGRMGTRSRLHAGLLIGTHHMHPLRMPLLRVVIERTDGLDVCVAWLRLLASPVIEPIAGLMRLEVRCFLTTARYGA